MSTPFRLTVGSFGGIPVLHLGGDLVFGQGITELRETVRHLAVEGQKRVVLNLSELQTVDSRGIGALLDVRHALGDQDSRVFLLRPPERLRGSLNLMRVTSMFDVVDDETDLIRRLASADSAGRE